MCNCLFRDSVRIVQPDDYDHARHLAANDIRQWQWQYSIS
jgi:hypothetical protein